MSFTTKPLFSNVLVFGFVKYFLISVFKSLALCLKSISPLAFLTAVDTADLNSEGLIKLLSNMVLSMANVELTPEALLTNLASVPFVKTKYALPPLFSNCLFKLFFIVFAVPTFPEAHTSPNLVTKNTPPSPSNITLSSYLISPANISSGAVIVTSLPCMKDMSLG